MIKTKGIVFRSLKYRETSMILDIYTEELGLRAYIINGVRSSSSKKNGNILQPLSQLELVVSDKNGAEKLNRIVDYKLDVLYKKIPFDVIRSMIAQFMIEVLRKCVKDDEKNPDVYQFIVSWFEFLDQTNYRMNNLIIGFLIELATLMGFAFDLEKENNESYFDLKEGHFSTVVPSHEYYLDSALSAVLFEFIHCEKENIHDLTILNKHRSKLIDQLIIYYRLHVDSFGEMKSLEILRSII